MYRATIYLDLDGDAAVDTDGTGPEPTLEAAVAAGQALAVKRGWALWSGSVQAGSMVPWIPEPGIELEEWEPAGGEENPDAEVAYFGLDPEGVLWIDRTSRPDEPAVGRSAEE